jgi:serine/threonine protein kinase
VIIDFGLATLADALPYLYFRCGTPGFLSPEIANLASKKERQACSSDMFSLGCIFYKMLTGHYLFGGKTAKEVLQNNRKCIFSSSFDGLSLREKKLLQRMIDPNPATRITPE